MGESPSESVSGLGASPGKSMRISRQGASPASAAKRLTRQRMAYSLPDQQELGREACQFRDSFFEEYGKVHGWRNAFVAQRFHFDDLRLPAAKAICKQLRCAVETAKAGWERERNRQGTRALARSRVVPPHRRKRRGSGPRNVKCPVISEELWSWFVDRLRNCPGRVTTQLLIDQANIVAGDVYDDWLVRRAQGHADASCPPKLPQIDTNWVARWRSVQG